MSKKLSRIDKYDASPDQILVMLQDPDYVAGKYKALGDISSTVVEHTPGDGTLALKMDRTVPADLPGFAKKVLGETNQIIQTENWTKTADGYATDVHIEFPGKPLGITGRLEVKGTSDSTSDWNVNMEFKASVPLIGGKLEGVIEKETVESLDKEYAFNKEWLASH